MNKRKIYLYAAIGFLLLVFAGLIIGWENKSKVSAQLPEVPDFSESGKLLKEQVLQASEIAEKKPTSENIGHLGMVYHSGANYELAEECYKLAIQKNPKDWKWYYYLGYLKKEMGDSKAAVNNFREVTMLNPDVFHAWYYAGEGFQNLNFNEEAETVFNKVAFRDLPVNSMEEANTRVDFFPLNIYAKYQLARIYLNTDRLGAAERVLKEITDEYKSFGPAFRLIGQMYSLKGDSAWSKYYVIRANDLSIFSEPVDTLVDELVKLSRSDRFLLKQIDEAEKSVNTEWTDKLVTNALEYLPENRPLVSKAIKLYLKMDLNEKAVSLSAKHLNLYQDDFNELNATAGLFFDKKLFEKALQYCNRALQLKPENYRLQSQAAMCNWALNNNEEALNQVDNMLRNGENNPDVLTEGVSLLFTFNQDEKALNYFTKLKKIAPDKPAVFSLQGIIAEHKGDTEKALDFFEKAFQADTEDMSNVVNFIDLLISQKKWQQSLKYLRIAMAVHPNEPYILERSGTILVTCENQNLRNVNLGKELSERAFYNKATLPDIMLSAGRSLVIANASLTDYQSAKFYMSIVLGLAEKLEVEKEYMEELQHLNNQLKGYS